MLLESTVDINHHLSRKSHSLNFYITVLMLPQGVFFYLSATFKSLIAPLIKWHLSYLRHPWASILSSSQDFFPLSFYLLCLFSFYQPSFSIASVALLCLMPPSVSLVALLLGSLSSQRAMNHLWGGGGVGLRVQRWGRLLGAHISEKSPRGSKSKKGKRWKCQELDGGRKCWDAALWFTFSLPKSLGFCLSCHYFRRSPVDYCCLPFRPQATGPCT